MEHFACLHASNYRTHVQVVDNLEKQVIVECHSVNMKTIPMSLEQSVLFQCRMLPISVVKYVP